MVWMHSDLLQMPSSPSFPSSFIIFTMCVIIYYNSTILLSDLRAESTNFTSESLYWLIDFHGAAILPIF
jgi:hypothetical protein